MASLQAASSVQQLDSHTYTGQFPSDWTIGTVPHGGYITTCFLRVASLHFSTTLKQQNQPHTIAIHLSFLRRTGIGAAQFKVQDIKLGRQTSVTHIALSQGGREEVVAYLINSNLHTEAGVTLHTDWSLQPPPPPIHPFYLKRLRDGVMSPAEKEKALWAEQGAMPFAKFRKATSQMRFFFPIQGQGKGRADEWMCFKRPGERWTNTSVGMIADMWPQVLEPLIFGEDEDPYALGASEERRRSHERSARLWYPTVLLNLDVKKALPEEGVEFLFARVRAKRIQNGRYDLEVVILDQVGDVVALSNHVVFAVDASRNTAERRKTEESKL